MLPPRETDAAMIAPCGLNCALCYRHLGKKPCPGCRKLEPEPESYQRKCVMRDCVSARGLFSCADCVQRPCKRVKAFEKRYREGYGVDLAADAARQREAGVETLFQEQIESHTCGVCGHLINLHDGICSGCKRQYPIGKGSARR